MVGEIAGDARGRWTRHLFQSRFASVAMHESHLRSAVSYVSLNPVIESPALPSSCITSPYNALRQARCSSSVLPLLA
jgi:hypothetical protein